MLVPGAIAATWPASVMKVPAEAAHAPRGETNTITGHARVQDRLDDVLGRRDRPPGVSSSITSAAAPSLSLCAIAFCT